MNQNAHPHIQSEIYANPNYDEDEMYGRNSESESGMPNYFNSTTSNVCEVLICMAFTHIPLDEMSVISLITSSNALCWAKMIEFGFNCLRNFFARVQLTINKSCSGDGLVPNRGQAISWTNADPHQSGPHENPPPPPPPHPTLNLLQFNWQT